MTLKNAFALVVTLALAIVMALPGSNSASYDGRIVRGSDHTVAAEPAFTTALPLGGEVMATGVSGGGNGGG